MLETYENLIQYPKDLEFPILNISKETFGIARNGDIIGILNVVAHLRYRDNNPNIKFYLHDDVIVDFDYCRKFKKFILENTDYLSETPGTFDITNHNINVWNYRGAVGDYVKIKNNKTKQEKIVIFPIFDSTYNFYRNWSPKLFLEILTSFKYLEYKKYICCKDSLKDYDTSEYIISNDFIENINHILESSIYVGGDTGMTHFASILDPSPMIYYYTNGEHGRIYTLPFYSNKIKMILYDSKYNIPLYKINIMLYIKSIQVFYYKIIIFLNLKKALSGGNK